MSFPDYMSQTEKKICSRLIKATLSRNYLISVYDGEEWVLKKSTDAKAVKGQTGHTEVTHYAFHMQVEDGTRRLGSTILIHGNEEDVISDAAWPKDHPEFENLINELCDEANNE